MPREFLTISQDEIDLKLAEAIRSRELELLSYDFELEAHREVASRAITQDVKVLGVYGSYRGMARDQLIGVAIAQGHEELLPSIAELQAIDRAKHEMQAVMIESGKSQKHLDYLLSQLPEDRRASAFEALRNKEEQEKAARLAR